MRISDWSSDVCSSDLCIVIIVDRVSDLDTGLEYHGHRTEVCHPGQIGGAAHVLDGSETAIVGTDRRRARKDKRIRIAPVEIGRAHAELQSLMRISYAVFCLKKKKQNNSTKHINAKQYKSRKPQKNHKLI